MMSAISALVLGLIVYLGTAALGTAAQLRLVNTHPFRWVHHVLFALVWLSLALALITSWPKPWVLPLIGVAIFMALLPRFRAGTRPHCLNALLGMGAYFLAIGWAALN